MDGPRGDRELLSIEQLQAVRKWRRLLKKAQHFSSERKSSYVRGSALVSIPPLRADPSLSYRGLN
jgi:hypothetical protein